MTTTIPTKDASPFSTPAPPTPTAPVSSTTPSTPAGSPFGTPEHPFVVPVKRITNPTELSAFHRSPAFRSLIGYIQKLCEVAEGKQNLHGTGSEVCLFFLILSRKVSGCLYVFPSHTLLCMNVGASFFIAILTKNSFPRRIHYEFE